LSSKILIIKDDSTKQSDYLPIESFVNEIDLIDSIINFINKIYKHRKKKKENFNYSIHLNFFDAALKQDFTSQTAKDGITKIIYFAMNYLYIKDQINSINYRNFYKL
jgi:hypothetical protein